MNKEQFDEWIKLYFENIIFQLSMMIIVFLIVIILTLKELIKF